MQDGFVLALFVTDLLPAWHVCPSSFSALPVHYSPPWLCVSNSYTACLTAGGRGRGSETHTVALLAVRVCGGAHPFAVEALCTPH